MINVNNLIDEKLKVFISDNGINITSLLNEDFQGELYKNLVDKIYEDIYLNTNTSQDSTAKRKFTIRKKEEISHILDNLLTSFMGSCEKYLPKESNLNEAIVEILKILIDELNKEVNSKSIYDEMFDFSSDVDNKDLTKRSLANIKCLQIADYIMKSKFNTLYKIDFDKWFNEYRKYYIHNKSLLKELSPLLVAYLKSNKGISTDDFFEIIEKVIFEFLKPIEFSSINYSIEYEILKAINKGEKITIITDGRGDTFTNKTISPIKITINKDNSRTIEYYDYNKTKEKINISKIREINLSNIHAINDEGIPAREYLIKYTTPKQLNILKEIEFKLVQNYYLKTEILEKLETKIIEDKEQIILECNTNLLEYFLYKPLQNQSIFKTEDELKYFEEVYKYKAKDNKFYVVGNDTITNASSSVLKCLGEVKVLTPISLNDFVNEKIQKHTSLSSSS
ncbi:hypothetical protein CRU98_08510 [Arcobacter sp. CECT 8986]|uniref:hypothetical protein n=1 Tax=Arcobacter sp. CECT 8986 TaxID=2044507 RepID=UPI0010099176|nr:hypothetical protein [Arcobacter sp. CECT 8986]RXJ98797.1 hypothetical protein CRU98_08510 [Arcobacter sp. CECT 8986]